MRLIDFPTKRGAVEWPTAALAAVIYSSWLALTFWHDKLPWWALTALGAWIVAWHMSLQHEVIHGHPTGSRRLNDFIGAWPLALWIPYEVYRRTHLQHHIDARLTDPLDDPESYYWTRRQWESLGPLGRAIVRLQATLLGRVLVGPAWAMARFWYGEAKTLGRGEFGDLGRLARFGLELAAVLIWTLGVCGMSFWTYFFCFAYAGTGLALVRSFAEHRANGPAERRTAIVEHSSVFGVLFLFNNLHVAHHLRAGMPWYELPRWYRLNREALIARNGGLLYDSYFDVARRYGLRPHDAPVHPFLGDRPG